MKWNIDTALIALSNSVELDYTIHRAVVPRSLWGQYQLKPKVPEDQQSAMVWGLTIGRPGGPKLMTYALTIHDAYLKIRRQCRVLSEEDANLYGVKYRKPFKKFERRLRKPKAAQDSVEKKRTRAPAE